MKTPEELKALKSEVETMNRKLAELSEEELAQVSGGAYYDNRNQYIILKCDNPGCIVHLVGILATEYRREQWCPLCGSPLHEET